MKTLKQYTLLLLLLPLSATAQQPDRNYSGYFSSAGQNALIFRGRRALQYEMRFNGHPYWDGAEFIKGDVTYNGRHYIDVLMNIDAFTQELQIKKDAVNLPIRLEREYVESLSIGGTVFRDLCADGVADAQEGFYEQLKDGPQPVYRRVSKIYCESAVLVSEESLGYRVDDFNPSWYNYFERRVRLYTVKDGRLRKIGKSKASKLAGYEIH